MDMKSKYSINNYDMSKVSAGWVYKNLTEARKAYVDRIVEHAPDLGIDLEDMTFSRKQLRLVSLSFKDNDDVPNWIVKDHDRRAMQGVYIIPEVVEQSTGASPINTVLTTDELDTDEFGDDDAVFELEPQMATSVDEYYDGTEL